LGRLETTRRHCFDADEAIFVLEEVCRDRAIRDRASSIAEEDPACSVGRSCIGLLFWAWKCIENDGADEARDLYNVVLKTLEGILYVKGCLASSLYHMRLFYEAQDLFEQIFAEDEFCLEGVDT
jgi:hypothetical protein